MASQNKQECGRRSRKRGKHNGREANRVNPIPAIPTEFRVVFQSAIFIRLIIQGQYEWKVEIKLFLLDDKACLVQSMLNDDAQSRGIFVEYGGFLQLNGVENEIIEILRKGICGCITGNRQSRIEPNRFVLHDEFSKLQETESIEAAMSVLSIRYGREIVENHWYDNPHEFLNQHFSRFDDYPTFLHDYQDVIPNLEAILLGARCLLDFHSDCLTSLIYRLSADGLEILYDSVDSLTHTPSVKLRTALRRHLTAEFGDSMLSLFPFVEPLEREFSSEQPRRRSQEDVMLNAMLTHSTGTDLVLTISEEKVYVALDGRFQRLTRENVVEKLSRIAVIDIEPGMKHRINGRTLVDRTFCPKSKQWKYLCDDGQSLTRVQLEEEDEKQASLVPSVYYSDETQSATDQRVGVERDEKWGSGETPNEVVKARIQAHLRFIEDIEPRTKCGISQLLCILFDPNENIPNIKIMIYCRTALAVDENEKWFLFEIKSTDVHPTHIREFICDCHSRGAILAIVRQDDDLIVYGVRTRAEIWECGADVIVDRKDKCAAVIVGDHKMKYPLEVESARRIWSLMVIEDFVSPHNDPTINDIASIFSLIRLHGLEDRVLVVLAQESVKEFDSDRNLRSLPVLLKQDHFLKWIKPGLCESLEMYVVMLINHSTCTYQTMPRGGKPHRLKQRAKDLHFGRDNRSIPSCVISESDWRSPSLDIAQLSHSRGLFCGMELVPNFLTKCRYCKKDFTGLRTLECGHPECDLCLHRYGQCGQCYQRIPDSDVLPPQDKRTDELKTRLFPLGGFPSLVHNIRDACADVEMESINACCQDPDADLTICAVYSD